MPPARGHRSGGLLREPVRDDGSASQDCDREQRQDRKSHPSQRVAEHPDSVHHKRFRCRCHGEHVTSHKRHGRSARDHAGDDLEMPEPIGAAIGIACRPGRSGGVESANARHRVVRRIIAATTAARALVPAPRGRMFLAGHRQHDDIATDLGHCGAGGPGAKASRSKRSTRPVAILLALPQPAERVVNA